MEELLFKKSKTIAEIVAAFFEAKESERYSPHTLDDYQNTFTKFLRFVGSNTRMESIETADIRSFLKNQDEISDKTLCNYHTALSSLWTWSVDNGYAEEHLVRKIRRPTYVKPRIIPFTEVEVKRLLRACRYARDRAIVMVLLDTGMRATELTGLMLDDWNDGTLHIRCGKGKKSRIVPISKATEKSIHRQFLKRKISESGIAGGEAIFASNISGKPMNYNALRSLMERLNANSGVSHVYAHRFRHTFATTFLRNGGDIYTLKGILGHSTLVMVQRYLDIVQSDLVRVHAKASPVSVWGIDGM